MVPMPFMHKLEQVGQKPFDAVAREVGGLARSLAEALNPGQPVT